MFIVVQVKYYLLLYVAALHNADVKLYMKRL